MKLYEVKSGTVNTWGQTILNNLNKVTCQENAYLGKVPY